MTDTLPTFFLKPGELFLAEKPCIVSTLLGSCMAVTMTTRRARFGAICHALLPSCRDGGRCDCPERFRYVACAVRGMIDAFARRGVPAGAIEAKIFGGAEMFHAGRGESVGSQNVARAGELLAAAGIRVAALDAGGKQGRKILFLPHSGEVFLRRLDRMATGDARSGAAP